MTCMNTSGITLLGLGPGSAELLTRQAWDLLLQTSELFIQSSQHPALAELPPTINVQRLEDGQTVERLLELARRPKGVVFGVPGNPLAANPLAAEVARRAREEGMSVQVVAGMGFLEPTCAALGVDLLPQTTVVDVGEVLRFHTPSFPPHVPALITGLTAQTNLQRLQAILGHVYPDTHSLHLVDASGGVRGLTLALFAEQTSFGPLARLYLPALGPATSFEGFQEIVAHLRAPEGCPWDRDQTHLSLRQSLLEETYEVLAALDAEDPHSLREELGDLLLQIVLHAQIANEYGEFRIADVIHDIQTKLVRRHPHVFGDLQVDGVDNVLQNWEKLKAAERAKKGKSAASLLDGVPKALPALTQAEQYQGRAARVGFEWPELQNVLDKIQEEIEEVRQAESAEERIFEIGDLFFATVNLARTLEVEPESALRQANQRFKARFGYIETFARQQERLVSDLSLEEMLALWQEAKLTLK